MIAAPLFPGEFFGALGWALFHFLWQGALVAALLAAFRVALARRSPALRYAVACGALVLMLVLPVATGLSLARRGSPAFPIGTGPAAAANHGAIETAATTAPAGAEAFLPASLESRLEALRPWALLVWFAGVLLLSLRFLGGFRAANRMKRRGTRPASQEWQAKLEALADRLSITRPVRLLESALVNVPTAIGAISPAILIPASVFTGLPARGIEAILAHELAHVRRHDYLVNLLQTVVETLLFYHPAVWWVSARVRIEREECCDDLAIAATGDARSYARALVRLEEMRGRAPSLAVAAAGGNLWNRVVRLLRERPSSSERASSWLAGALALALVAVLGSAARVGPLFAETAEAPTATAAEAPEAPDAVVVADADEPAGDDTEADSDEESAADPDTDADEKTPPPSATSERDLTEDQREAYWTHGVTPEFVGAVRALGYPRVDPDTILALKIHGVDPADIAEMNRIFGKQPLDEHVAFKIHGVTPDAVRHMAELGIGDLGPDEALAFRIHGVDAAFVEKLRAGGYDRLDADELVAAKIHGVRAEDADGWKKLGYPRPSLEELVAARIHGVDPEFAAEIRSAGISGTSLEDLVAFRIHGVSADFLREMRALGLDLSGEEATAFRIHGVTSGFVKEVQSLGYVDPDPEDLTALRIHGISAKRIRETNARAGRRLPLEDVIEYQIYGKDDDDDEE
jgi:beta-lactamase regulating signal transducer with metallopeptidase domain